MTITDTNRNTELFSLIAQTKKLCKLHGELGLSYPLTKELGGFLAPPKFDKAPEFRAPQKPIKKKETKPQQTTSSTNLNLAEIQQEIKTCQKCNPPWEPILGVGNQGQNIPILIICDQVTEQEKQPFSPEALDLLTKMIGAIDLKLSETFITPLVKCPKHAPVSQDEMEKCRSKIELQINYAKPKIICIMGQKSANFLLKNKNQLAAMRGRFHNLMDTKTMVTYPPSLLVKFPNLKKAAWYDLQLMQRELANT